MVVRQRSSSAKLTISARSGMLLFWPEFPDLARLLDGLLADRHPIRCHQGVSVEYTDTPAAESTEQPFATPNESRGFINTAEGAASDMVAVMLSIVPGLGHIYKGYRVLGVLLMFVGMPMALALALLIATGTAGFGFF